MRARGERVRSEIAGWGRDVGKLHRDVAERKDRERGRGREGWGRREYMRERGAEK
jgi:hypothetical protein